MLLTCFVLAAAAAAPPAYEVLVDAGDQERTRTVVAFTLPDAAAGVALRDEKGRVTPLQVDERGEAAFVLPRLAAGERARFTLVRATSPRPRVTATRSAAEVVLRVGGVTVAHYRIAATAPRADVGPEFLRGGYLHPLLTPRGVLVTDDYPPNHVHHHGVWSSWAETTFAGRKPDFWNMGKKTGRTELEAVDAVWSGPVHAGVRARQLHVDLGVTPPVPLAREAWRVTVWRTHDARPPFFLVDVDSTQEVIAGAPLLLREHRYGGIGLRGHRQWNGKDAASFLTSEGHDRATGNGTRARWVHLGGKVGRLTAGIAVLSHPSNFRAPQPTRLHPDEPFFNFAPVAAGPFELTPGKPYRARYRLVIADGGPDAALLERLWRDYADPPTVTVRKL